MTAAAGGPTGVGDVGAFLARLLRLDAAAVVRLRPEPDGAGTALWARLPWEVLVTRLVVGGPGQDVTVSAAELLATVASGPVSWWSASAGGAPAAGSGVVAGGDGTPLARRDADWRWTLPPTDAVLVDQVPVDAVRRIADAAASAMREARARGSVGDRKLRDALLDHVAVTVQPDSSAGMGIEPVELSQRLIQAIVRMGFLGGSDGEPGATVRVRVAGQWVELAAAYGSAWIRRSGRFKLNTHIVHTFGQPVVAPPVRQLT
ncbi:hypothetical protein [Pilimelia columellifera]|uniref:Uncharacterized protein n=1 Tax=Pilimelia columellifera subsp. columellifera TaxID=706583 RepID=A0ABP6B0A5_9ACTN